MAERGDFAGQMDKFPGPGSSAPHTGSFYQQPLAVQFHFSIWQVTTVSIQYGRRQLVVGLDSDIAGAE